ncbi:DUF1513 domain-containing protein [Pseudooceanicola nitratireducens]|uniref:DUF1513 domain-containing protein n=1 Tax=Pseudooceanicola nitratireducens TaxID=517719 RepID=UPI0023F2DAA3|nr:DUF1513 domain-containing protein [Pseudooceanicola nitratireducens]
MTTRRGFLASLLAASTMPRLSWADAGNPAYLAAAREGDGGYALFGLSETGADVFRIPLPGRGHAATAHPTAPEAVAFARRPGTFALVIDCVTGHVAHRLESPSGRHFYGHGAFVSGGEILCTTENDIDSGEGRIGFWSRRDGYARIGEIASGGIGPHEILALPGDVLAVANGGIRTHPARGRDKLNIPEMRPNLAYARVAGVEEVVELGPDLHLASIRHLASDGTTVGFAMQWQGDLPDPAPLLALHRRGSAPVLCSADLAEQMAMKGYAGSIAMAGDLVGITSPRGGRVHLFGLDGTFRRSLRRTDVCGLATRDGALLATDGLGGVLSLAPDRMEPLRVAPRAWDNHLVRIG